MTKDFNQFKNTVITSLMWKFVEKVGVQGIQFIVQIILARLLMPHDFGKLALITVFINFFNIFTQSSFNFALIQKKDTDDLDYSSVFYVSIVSSIIFYILMYILSPYIAAFYSDTTLIRLIRVLSIILIPLSLNSIQIAMISRNMEFKTLFFSNLFGIFLSGTVSIILALNGYGIWSLIVQSIISAFTNLIVLWFKVKWHPKMEFSTTRIKKLFMFGWKILVTNMIYNIYADSRAILIGKLYNPSILGYYNRGFQIPALIINNVDGAIQSVMLPTYSRIQDDLILIKSTIRRSVKIGSFIIFPIMIGISTIAELFVRIFLTEKWLPSIPYIIIFSIALAFRPINSASQEAITAIGRTDVTLKISLINRFIEFLILIITAFISVKAIALGTLIASIASTIINLYPNKIFFNYVFKELISDIYQSFICSIIMGAVVYSTTFLKLNDILLLSMQIILGFIVYLLLSLKLNNDTFCYLVNAFKKLSIFNHCK